MRYRDLQGAPVPADGVVVLPVASWSSTYGKRPGTDTAVGLRLPTEAELITAHAEATREADGRSGEARAFRFQEALVCWTLAAALCDPNDARQPLLERADEEIREAFPDETLRHLWHELERLRVACSPVRAEATDEEALELAALLEGGALAALSPDVAPRVRRLLRFCLDELTAAPDP